MTIRSLVNWMNSNPILYDGKSFKFVYFGLFTGVGVFFATISFIDYLNLYGYNPRYPMVFWTTLNLFLMLVFSKLFCVFIVGKDFFIHPIKHLRQTAFFNQGGQIGFLIGLAIMAFVENVNFLFLVDAVCYGGAIASFFGRIGCYNYGCCYGKKTESDFSVSYYNMNSKILRLHPEYIGIKLYPIQLICAVYDLLLYFIMTLIIYFNINYKVGIISLVFIIFYNLFRTLTQSLRNDTVKIFDKNDAPIYVIFAIFFTLLGLGIGSFILFNYSLTPTLFAQTQFTIGYYFGHIFLHFNNFIAAIVPAVMVFIVHSYHKELGKHF